jgi:hypothetical protein
MSMLPQDFGRGQVYSKDITFMLMHGKMINTSSSESENVLTASVFNIT